MADYPLDILCERGNLVRRSRSPEDRVETAIIIMESPRLRSYGVRQFTRLRRVHWIAVHQLDLDIDAVVQKPIDVIVETRRRCVDAALLLNPVPTGQV